MPSRYDVSRDELAALLAGEPRYRVEQLWHGLYRQLADPAELTTLPSRLRSQVADLLPPSLELEEAPTADGGETVKLLSRLSDGARIETVLMHARDRTTVCVSTQAGCAMACTFCATGQAGFQRHLTVGEVVEQVVVAARMARPRRVSNVVFMGMGEPLANLDRVWTAIERLHDDVGISARHITVSTVGVVPGIDRVSRAALPVGLAVSLHAARDRLRDQLVPLNRRYPLEALVAACERYVHATGRRLSFEWALIDGVNDQPRDVAELAVVARSLRAHVNLIPLNPTPGYAVVGSPPQRVRAFRRDLLDAGVNATVRRTRGTSIDAACGQLAARAPGAAGAVAVAAPGRPAAGRGVAPARM